MPIKVIQRVKSTSSPLALTRPWNVNVKQMTPDVTFRLLSYPHAAVVKV